MLDRIRNLAQFLKDKKNTGDKFVLMLGAGASLSSGVKPTAALMEEILKTFGRGLDKGTISERFDELWHQSSENDRKRFLEPQLNCSPSRGYECLADIIRMGFIDLIVTFNFDRLLESALDQAGFRNYRVIVRGETDVSVFSKLVESKEPRVKILKLHGSLFAADYFLFSKDEILNYPAEIDSLVRRISQSDIIICGYAFEDVCVIRAFSASKEDGSIYYVNPAPPPDTVRGFITVRRSQEKVISGDLGKFDSFFEALHAELAGTTDVARVDPEKKNPFKFLDYYHVADREWFLGRAELGASLVQEMDTNRAHAVHLFGPARVGKTSFVNAGLIAHLDPGKYECIYVRCTPDIENELYRTLEKKLSIPLGGKDLNAALTEVKACVSKCIVLVFDQFERAIPQGEKIRSQRLVEFMVSLLANSSGNLKAVFISRDTPKYTDLLLGLLQLEKLRALNINQVTRRIEPFDGQGLREIIQLLASKAEVQLDPEAVRKLCEAYDENTFTLTHVQTLCYYYVDGCNQDWQEYEGLANPGLAAALGSVTDDSNLMDLISDLPPEERALIRSVMKIICNPNATIKSVVEFIKNHFSDLKGKDSFPESVSSTLIR